MFHYKDEDEPEESEEGAAQKPIAPFPAVVKVDKECWTHEPEYDKYVKELTRKCFDFVTLLIVI